MIEYFASFFYFIPIQLIVTIVFILVYSIHYKRLKGMQVLLLYALISMAQSIFGIYMSVSQQDKQLKGKLVHISINIFMVFEMLIFSLFIHNCLKAVVTRSIIKLMTTVFVFICLHNWTTSDSFAKLPAFLTLVESYLMIIACLLYYSEILYYPSTIGVAKDYRFWTITGIFFLFIFFIPLFLHRGNIFFGKLDLYNMLYLMTFSGYIVLFTFFTIAIRWKIKN